MAKQSSLYFRGFGAYVGSEDRFNRWLIGSIYRPISREDLADRVREVRTFGRPGEAYAFLGAFKYLGTFPVINSGRWVNRYGRSTAAVEY